MKSIILSVCCLVAVISASAQPEWCAIMTQSSKGQAYNSFNTSKELEAFVVEQAKKGNVISEVVYGDGKWYGVATYSSQHTKIAFSCDEKFPSDWVSAKWKEEKYITKITYGDGKWFVAMTDQTPYVNQSWAKRSSWAEIEKFIKEKWNASTKYNITDIAYGDGMWYVVMSELKVYEKQSFKESVEFPNSWIDEKYKAGFNITSIEHDGEKWYLVVSQQTANDNETIFNPQRDFPAKKIQDKWDSGKRISSLVYARDIWDIDEEDDPLPVPSSSQSNRQKAATKLAAKDYPEAIRYYKAAIAEGNPEEVLWNNLAWAKYLNGNCSDALDDVNKAIAMKSTSYNNHTKATILKCQNKCSEALTLYDEAIRLHRKEQEKFTDGEYYADRADAKRCLGNYAGAIEDIELALKIEPNSNKLKETLDELNRLAGNK